MNQRDTLLVIKGIKSQENPDEAVADIRKRMGRCKKVVVKLTCPRKNYDYTSTHDSLFVRQKCHKRICPRCPNERKARLVSKYAICTEFMQYPRFMTLTLKEGLELTKESKKFVDDMYQELMRKLKRDGYEMKKFIKGLELKRLEDGKYRFHYHVLYDGSYIPQDYLSDAWKHITGGSFRVDVRKVYNPLHALFYISKYMTKAVDYDIPIEIYAKIQKLRFFNSRGFKGLYEEKKEPFAKCRCGLKLYYDGSEEA